MYKEVKGNLITMALAGQFDVIAHGCNCQCNMNAGIAVDMKRAFDVDKFPLEAPSYKGDVNKLGQVNGRLFYQEKPEYGGRWVEHPDESSFMTGKRLSVLNAYTQFNYGRNHADGDERPLDYAALELCLRKMNRMFNGRRIGLPQIGAGLAKGNWFIISKLIQDVLKDCDVTVVIWDGSHT